MVIGYKDLVGFSFSFLSSSFGLSNNKVSPKESYPREEGSPLPSVPHFAPFPFHSIPFLAWLAVPCALRETRPCCLGFHLYLHLISSHPIAIAAAPTPARTPRPSSSSQACVTRGISAMADEGGPYEDGDSPPARHGGDFYDAHADRDNGDNRKREVLYYWLARSLSLCAHYKHDPPLF